MLLRKGGAAIAAAALALAGCASNQLIYRWGSYESDVYDMYFRPGAADPVTQAARLSEDIERTKAEGKRVPPGVHAHLGYLYYNQGRLDAAYAEFSAEKELFPESTVFVDGILARMKQQ